MRLSPHDQFRRGALIGALEAVCQQLELSDYQRELAKGRYEGVGGWLSESSHPALSDIYIYVQGSVAIGTTVKPIGRNEHDVDLIAKLQKAAWGFSPAFVKKLIGDRLKEHGAYARLLEEMCRCWRLDYANEFHLDITPSVPNPACLNGGELVPDRELRDWKASNPKGYQELFARRAKLQPRLTTEKSSLSFDEGVRATVEPYPSNGGFKGILRRIVQIAKRHRDVYFANRDNECAPISVIVTTLMSQSYEWCVTNRSYEDELELLTDVIGRMIEFVSLEDGRWCIWNETTADENFAEKWNSHPDRAASFFAWHHKFASDLNALLSVDGVDRIAKGINDAFGSGPASVAVKHIERSVSDARSSGGLRYGASGLISTAPALAVSKPSVAVARNTFFGR